MIDTLSSAGVATARFTILDNLVFTETGVLYIVSTTEKNLLSYIYWDFRIKFCCVKKRTGFYFDQSERRNEFLTREKFVSSNHKPRFKRIVFSRAFSQSSRVVRNSNLSRARIYFWGRLNLSMYKINKLQHGKHFVRDFHTRWWSIRNLTRSLRSLVRFQILHQLAWKSHKRAHCMNSTPMLIKHLLRTSDSKFCLR